MGRASPAGLWGPQGHSHSLPSGRSKPGPCFIGCPLSLTGMFLPSLLPTPAGGGRIQFYHPAVRPDGPPPGGHATDGVCRGRRGIDQPSHHEQRGFRQPFESQSLPGRPCPLQRAPLVLAEEGRGPGEPRPVLGGLEPALPGTSGHLPWTGVRPAWGVPAAQPVPFFQIVDFLQIYSTT